MAWDVLLRENDFLNEENTCIDTGNLLDDLQPNWPTEFHLGEQLQSFLGNILKLYYAGSCLR